MSASFEIFTDRYRKPKKDTCRLKPAPIRCHVNDNVLFTIGLSPAVLSVLNFNILVFRGPWSIPVEFRITTFATVILFAVLSWSSGIGLEYVGLAVLLYGMIFLHELGHAWACRMVGVQVHGITIHAFGGLCSFDARGLSVDNAAFIVAMGPLVNLALWASAALLAGQSWTAPMHGVLGWIAMLNLILAVLNLVPALPADGGQILRLWLLGFLPEQVANRITGAVGLALLFLWFPAFLFTAVLFHFLLLYWVPVQLHWHMLRYGDLGERYSPVKTRFWHLGRRPKGPWDGQTLKPVPAE